MVVQSPSSSSKAVPALTPEEQRKIRLLKAICIGLGVLIMIALGAMIIGFVTSGTKTEHAAAPKPADVAVIPQGVAPVANVAPALAAFDINMAPGHVIRQATLDGNRLVIVSVAGAGSVDHAASEVIIVDIASGKVLSRIGLKAGVAKSAGE